MSLEKYKKVFTEALSIDQSKFDDKVKYNDIPEWDSIGHMTLISELEENFRFQLILMMLLILVLLKLERRYYLNTA